MNQLRRCICTGMFLQLGIGLSSNAAPSQRSEAAHTREMALNPTTVGVTRRATCINNELLARGADPSKLRVVVNENFNATVASVLAGPDTPPLNVEHEVRRTLKEIGFKVVVPMQKQPHDPNRWPDIFSVVIASNSPLTQSLSRVEEGDLLFLSIDRDSLVARGTVRVTVEWQKWDGEDYTVWRSSQAQGNFYMIKDKRTINAALTTGRATIGRGKERVEVNSIQDATLLVVQHAVASTVGGALAVDC